MIFANTKITPDEWILIGGIIFPVVSAYMGKKIANLRKQVADVIHTLHTHDRLLNGEPGVGPGLIKRVVTLEGELDDDAV
jgi:hypothetical protein